MNSPKFSAYTGLVSQSTGIILILSALLDFVTLAIPVKLLEEEWQIRFTNLVVDRGIVPLVGMIFFLVGYWLSQNVSKPQTTKKKSFDLRLAIFSLASLLSLFFLILVPIHIGNVNSVTQSAITQIQEGAGEAEDQIQSQYDQLQAIADDSARLEELEQRITQIDAALTAGEVNGQPLNAQNRQQLEQNKQQLESFRELAQDPELLEARLQELQTQLRTQLLERENVAKLESFKQGVRISVNSLLLAIAYGVIGWFGLKTLTKNESVSRTSAQ